MKREHPEFFRVQRCVEWKGMKFSAIGNLFLLRKPMKMQVQCSRRLTDDEIERKKAEMLTACSKGAVLVSAKYFEGRKSDNAGGFQGRLSGNNSEGQRLRSFNKAVGTKL